MRLACDVALELRPGAGPLKLFTTVLASRSSGESHQGSPFSRIAAGRIEYEGAAILNSRIPKRWLDVSSKGRHPKVARRTDGSVK
ncbi:unnamed protein product [Heligmosomoides polygyrus]|uniref:Transposase n=1 Tax=Heligmosomoides polygyrus TaxID=6339 RepID=A0A183FL33_HELPZ|nr:unnamed protein product [Heligmosomoides polygyrus]